MIWYYNGGSYNGPLTPNQIASLTAAGYGTITTEVAPASEFYFGRRMEDLRPQEVALLVGMVKGPSYYDPRRAPDRALTRRNLVLQEFADTGLLNAAQASAARRCRIKRGSGFVSNRISDSTFPAPQMDFGLRAAV